MKHLQWANFWPKNRVNNYKKKEKLSTKKYDDYYFTLNYFKLNFKETADGVLAFWGFGV